MWKDIEGYEGSYQVSERGEVRSLKNGRWGNARRAPRILKPALCDGYYKVALSKDNKLRSFRVHRLVALHFLQERSDPTLTVNHKDGNRTNNHVDNLEWATNAEQSIHRHRVLRTGSCLGAKNGCAVLTDEKVVQARTQYYAGEKPGTAIAKELGVSKTTAYRMLKGLLWSHLPVPNKSPPDYKSAGQCRRRKREKLLA